MSGCLPTEGSRPESLCVWCHHPQLPSSVQRSIAISKCVDLYQVSLSTGVTTHHGVAVLRSRRAEEGTGVWDAIARVEVLKRELAALDSQWGQT